MSLLSTDKVPNALHDGCDHPPSVEQNYVAMYEAAKDLGLGIEHHPYLVKTWWTSLSSNCARLVNVTLPLHPSNVLSEALEASYNAKNFDALRDYLAQPISRSSSQASSSQSSPSPPRPSHDGCNHFCLERFVRVCMTWDNANGDDGDNMNKPPPNNPRAVNQFLVATWYDMGCKLLLHIPSPNHLPDLPEVVKQCIREERTISSLADYIYDQHRIRQPTNFAIRANTLDIEATRRAFQHEYQGRGADVLLHIIDNAYMHMVIDHRESIEHHARSFVVVQSSGMGKSRTVAQAARQRYALIFTLRESTPGGYAFPESDEEVLKFLTRHRSDEDGRKIGILFLWACFETMAAHLKSEQINNPAAWFGWLQVNQALFCREVVQMASAATMMKNPTAALSRQLMASATSLLKSTGINIFICFDEAHTLLEMQPRRNRSPYDDLQSALCNIASQPIYALFVSTSSALGDLAYSRAEKPSYRAQNRAASFAPITELPFDVFAIDRKLTMHQAMQIEHAAKFGRPLWFTMFRALKDGNSATNVVTIARNKLRLTSNANDDPIAKFSWLSIRIGLNIDTSGKPDAKDVEAELVRSYMRVVFAVPRHRLYMRTGTPSEPVLAEAAAKLLNKVETSITVLAERYVDILCSAVQLGWASRGDLGELCLRLLWVVARDAAWKNGKELASDASELAQCLEYMRPVSIPSFLSALLQPEYYRKVSATRPVGDKDGLTLEEAFKNAYINFSHFALAGDSEVLRDTRLSRLLMRGVALQCMPTHSDVGVVAPVHFLTESESLKTTPISPQSTGRMQGQAKNRESEAATLVSPSIGCTSNHPVLTLFHEFGSNTAGVTFPDHPSVTCSGSSPHGQHYQVIIDGLSEDVYRPLSADVAKKLQSLLKQHRVADDHPRSNDSECLSAMWNQKPEFTKTNVNWGS